MGWSRWSYVLVAGLGLALAGCHAIEEELTPTQPTSATPAPLAIPVILPTPKPTPTPGPTPTPEPSPTPGTPTGSCGLPESNPSSPSCTDESPRLYEQMNTALTQVTKKHPEIFDFDDKKCDDCYYVKNVSAYLAQAIKELNAQGVCADYDGEEMAVKVTNNYSEQYDILLASGHMRRGTGSYRGVCRPAVF